MRLENCFPRTWVKRFMRHYTVPLEMHFVPPDTCASVEARQAAEKPKVVSNRSFKEPCKN